MRKRQSTGTFKLDLDVFIPLLISLIVLFVIFISVGYFYEEDYTQITLNRENVLKFMEDKLEFCEIQKEEIQSNDGRFWMLCNDRPYYAEFVDGKMVDDMNGWSFLREQPDVFNELTEDNCDFLYSKNNTLFFYCNNRRSKIYDFDIDSFMLENGRDENFVIVMYEDIKNLYGCLPYGHQTFNYEGERFFSLKLNCNEQDIVLNFNLNKTVYSLPVVIDGNLSNKEKAVMSFQRLGICRLDEVDNVTSSKYILSVFCGNLKENFLISYDLDLGLSELLFSASEFENSFNHFQSMLFPFLQVNEVFIRFKTEDNNDFYRNSRIIVVSKDDFIVNGIYLKDEGFNANK